MTTNTLRHVEALQAAAYDMQEQLYKAGYYTRDAGLLDKAVKAGRSGVVILFDEDGEPDEVHCIGTRKAEAHVEKDKNDPSHWTLNYSPLDEHELARSVARGKSVREEHEDLDPVNVQGVKFQTAGKGQEPHSTKPTNAREVMQTHPSVTGPLAAMRDAARHSPLHVSSDPTVRAIQQQKAADARAAYDEQRQRNEAIFARMKDEAAKLWASKF